LANRTLALHLPGGRQLFVTTGGALWTQQRSSGYSYERRKKVIRRTILMWHFNLFVHLMDIQCATCEEVIVKFRQGSEFREGHCTPNKKEMFSIFCIIIYTCALYVYRTPIPFATSTFRKYSSQDWKLRTIFKCLTLSVEE